MRTPAAADATQPTPETRPTPATRPRPRTPSGPVLGIHDTRPASRWEDAFLSGNGEVGIMVFGPPGHERVVHDHHRFVLPDAARDAGPPDVASRLEEVRDLILAGRRREAQRAFSDGRALAWTQAFHPGHVLHLDVDDMADGPGPPPDYRRATRFTTGEVITSWSDGPTAHRHRAFVSRPDRVVVHELTGPALTLTLRLSADTPGLPADVVASASAEAGPDGAWLALVARYPDVGASGRGAGHGEPEGFCGLTRVVVEGGTVTVDGDAVRVRAARRVLLLTRPARWAGSPRMRRARTALAALPADYGRLLGRHVAEHGELFGRCALDLGAGDAERDLDVAALVARGRSGTLDPALVEALFASGRYLLLSSCGVLPPRLTGLWLGAWGAAWSGDLTTDANLNLQLAGVTTTGMPELLAGYVAMLAAQVEDWRLNARRIYGARGVLAPSRTDGEHGRLFHLDDDWPWPMWLAGADWLLLPLVEYWQASGDDDFLAVLAPWLFEVAVFFEDVLTRTDADGHLVLVPSYSPEIGPVVADGVVADGVVTDGAGGDGVAGVNATMDLAAARHALGLAADVAERLGADDARGLAARADAVRWRALAARLPPYRVDARGALAEWAWPGLETAEDHRHVSHLYPVWPLHEITPDTTPELAAAAAVALAARGDEDLSAHGSLHRALVAARLKDARGARGHLLKILGRDMLHRSLMTSHNPRLEVYNADAAHCLPAVVVELLLDSRPGTLELLPALPPEWVRGRLTGSPTRAGVTVEELSWDRRVGEVRAVLCAAVQTELTLVCRSASDPDDVRRRLVVGPGAARVVSMRTVVAP